jgi:hypothetical protein
MFKRVHHWTQSWVRWNLSVHSHTPQPCQDRHHIYFFKFCSVFSSYQCRINTCYLFFKCMNFHAHSKNVNWSGINLLKHKLLLTSPYLPKTLCVTIIKTDWLLLFWDIIAVYSAIKYINTLCGQNAELFKITFSSWWYI